MRFHFLIGTEVADPTWRQVIPLNGKSLTDVLSLPEDEEHYLRVAYRLKDPAAPEAETASAQAADTERERDLRGTAEPPNSDPCEQLQ